MEEQGLLPLCVRFNPDDIEVIQRFLNPYIQHAPLPGSLIEIREGLGPIISAGPDHWNSDEYPYFRAQEYWFYITRKIVGKKKLLPDRSLGPLGKWIPMSTESKIKVGQVVIGLKRKLGLVKNKLQTGWYQVEYSRFNITGDIETNVVCRLVFDPTLRETTGDVGEVVAPPLVGEHGENVQEDGEEHEHGENVQDGEEHELGENVQDGENVASPLVGEHEHGENVQDGEEHEHGENVQDGENVDVGEHEHGENVGGEHGDHVDVGEHEHGENVGGEHGDHVGEHVEHGEDVADFDEDYADILGNLFTEEEIITLNTMFGPGH